MSVFERDYIQRAGSEYTDYDGFSVEYRDASHRYWLVRGEDRTPVVSVTSALKVLDKPALIGWAERCGVEAALEAERAGDLQGIATWDALGVLRGMGRGADAKRDAGADRGTAIHTALNLYCSEGKIPKVGDFDPAVRGYVSALCKWLVTASPEPILVERVVAHPDARYAGRLDLLAMIDGRTTLVDLKTNPAGRVYPEAHLQAAAYCLALEACGFETPDHAVIVAAGEEGTFQESRCCSGAQQFLDVLKCHESVKRVQAGVRAQERAAEA